MIGPEEKDLVKRELSYEIWFSTNDAYGNTVGKLPGILGHNTLWKVKLQQHS